MRRIALAPEERIKREPVGAAEPFQRFSRLSRLRFSTGQQHECPVSGRKVRSTSRRVSNILRKRRHGSKTHSTTECQECQANPCGGFQGFRANLRGEFRGGSLLLGNVLSGDCLASELTQALCAG